MTDVSVGYEGMGGAAIQPWIPGALSQGASGLA
jgi:hypothetical protein